MISRTGVALLGLAAVTNAISNAAVQTIDAIPLAFTESHREAGPGGSAIRYSAHGRGMSVEIAPDAAYVILDKASLPIRVTGMSAKSVLTAIDPQAGKANFLIGKDPKQWRTDVKTFGKIAFRGVLPGVDLIYYGNSKKLEYDFEVAPGADPKGIQMEIGPGWKVSVTKQGTLLIRSPDGGAKVEFDKPVSYQLAANGARLPVSSAYRLAGNNRFGFNVGQYDRAKPLVIDPVLVYGTYLGGAVADIGMGIAIDSSGSAYVTGRTESASFPTLAGFQSNCGTLSTSPFCSNSTYLPFGGGPRSNSWAFVTKFNPQGTQIVYSTYIGGDSYADGAQGTLGGTIAHAIAVDSSGNAYIGGQTQSLAFPVTGNALQATKAKILKTTWPGPCAPPSLVDTDANSFYYDGFVTKLNASGNGLLYSTYLGGSGQDGVNGIAANAAGEFFVVGSTHSRQGGSLNSTGCSFDQGKYSDFGFPTTSNAAYPEVTDRRTNVRLGFYTKFNANGTIAYSTYVGTGRPSTAPNDGKEGHIDAVTLAVDSNGAAFIAGNSEDEFFGGGCNTCASASHRADAFILKINANGAIGYGPTLFGGSSHDYASGIALDAAGNAYFAGSSDKEKPGAEFPTTAGSYQTARTNSINNNCPILVKVSPSGSTLFATFVCGNARNARAYAVAVDPTTQTPVITGNFDDQLPLVSNISFNAPTGSGVFLTRLNATGSSLLFSSFIGAPSGTNDNGSTGNAVVVDSQMNAFVAGNTGTANGTLATAGSYDTTPNGGQDVFVSKVSLVPAAPVLSTLSTAPNPAVGGQAVTITLNGSGFDTSLAEAVIGGTVISNASITTKTLTQLVFTTTLATGSYSVTARNASFGTASNALSLTVTGPSTNPSISSITPNPATAGSNTFTISGSNFNPANAQVEIGGSVIGNALLSTKTASQLVFTTPLQAGSYSILARNGVGGTASNAVNLTVNGITSGQGSLFVPIAPCRASDTRQSSIMGGSSTRDFTFANCGVPANATAVALNVTIVPSGAFGYLSIFPSGLTQPTVSTMNSLDGRVKANAAIVGLGVASAISIFVTNTTHVILDVNGYFVPPGTAGALAFYPVTPCRVVDTRSTGGIIAAQGSRRISGGCLPSSAQAYSLNVTVVPPGPLGFLTLWPDGTSQPTVSTLNDVTGTVVANAAVLVAGTGGAFNAYVTEASHVIADLNGYFASPGSPGALAFYPSTPCRIFDTRNAAGAFGGPAMAPDSSRSFTIPSSACNIPTTAQAYVTNATVVPSAPFGFLTLWAGGQARPTVSVLNAVDGAITSNAAIVPAGSNGMIQAYTSDGTHLLLDISGYFAP